MGTRPTLPVDVHEDRADTGAARAAVEALRQGQFAVLARTRGDESEGSLVVAAQHADSRAVQFMVERAYGLIRLCLTDERCDELGLEPLVQGDELWQPTAAISLRDGSGTGASAADRSSTILAAADGSVGADAFSKHGHVFPLRARRGGVLERPGLTEAAVDLARLAGCVPATAMTLVSDRNGSVRQGQSLRDYCREHDLPLVTIADVLALRRQTEKLVERVAEVQLPTPQGVFRGIAYRDRAGMTHHLAIVSTASPVSSEVLVRVQAECLAGEVFGSRRCSCGADLARSLELLASEGGVFVYLTDAAERARVDRHGADGAAPPPLDYLPAVQILADLGVTAMRLLTHDGTVPAALAEQGIPVTSAVALRPMSDKAAAAH